MIEPYWKSERGELYLGDALSVLRTLPAESVNCCVTSPPYWGLRDYGVEGQLGLERTPEEYVANMVEVFREVRRVLRDDGTLWLNLGISYAGYWGDKYAHKPFGEDRTADSSTPPNKPSLAFGGKSASRYPLLQRVPSCGNGGKESQDSQASDRACHGCDDERRGEIQTRHGCTAHNAQYASQDERQTSQIDHNNGPLDCGQELPHFSQIVAQESTTEQSSFPPSDVFYLEGGASVSQQSPSASSLDVQRCVDKSACTSGTSQMLPPLVVHTQGKESFFSACRRSDCKGIGKCGLCWCSLAIPSLNVKPKDEINIPHLVAMALQADGWVLRQTIVWHKPNPMPESVTDRCTKSHEYIFLLSKSQRYYFDAEAIKEPSAWPDGPNSPESIKSPYGQGFTRRSGNKERKPAEARGVPVDNGGKTTGAVCGSVPWEGSNRNKRSVWTVATAPFTGWSQTVHWERVALGGVSGGMRRIASPNCPIHGHQDFRYDGHGACLLNHSGCIDSGHVQEQVGVAICNLPNPGEQNHGCSSDFQYQDNDPSAICHSIENHKKDHAQRTNPSCSVCGKTLSRIDDIQEELSMAGLAGRISESNTWPGAMDDHPLVQTLFRIVRKSSLPIPPKCLCIYYHRKVSKSSHFATFPPKLIEPCVLAGSPAGGTVIDPFMGAGTTAIVSYRHGRRFAGIELSQKYLDEITIPRIENETRQMRLFA